MCEEVKMRRIVVAGLGIVLSLGIGGLALAAETGTAKSVTGVPEDSFCYITMGAKGPSHAKCAVACAKKGIPVTLVETGTNKMYVLIPPKNDEPLPDDLINKMEEQVTVSGKEFTKGGVNYLTVESVK
jgi:hypothetical protein